ncbi:MAG TPA: hypothetical protein DGG94_08335 [Micromonosporaceae bacterium]|nr:hypothetical protein [Micromonosporaceae bacterium]HCU49792.1 hypothetical protein [Micromonosporaceae bacterium]
MLPGGMTPVVQLVAIIRNASPRDAAQLLKDMPVDRLPVVTAAMGPGEVARLLWAAPVDFRGALIDALTTEQLLEVLRAQQTNQAVTLLSMLPDERLGVVAESLSDKVVAALLTRLPDSRQAAVLEAMDPAKGFAALSRRYEQEVADSLVRANVEVTFPNGAPNGIVLVQGLGWRIVVAARYGDDGTIALRDAEDGAYRLEANGALSVTNLRPADAVVGHCRELRIQGQAVDAMRWTDTQHDGVLKRILVSLFQ